VIDPKDLEPSPANLWRHGAGIGGVPYGVLRDIASHAPRMGTPEVAYHLLAGGELERRHRIAERRCAVGARSSACKATTKSA
jgi:hypothetical protein